jgi:hypothetical protein
MAPLHDAKSVTSPSTQRTAGFSSVAAPAGARSKTTTFQPAETSCSTRFRPRKPAPPETKAVFTAVVSGQR